MPIHAECPAGVNPVYTRRFGPAWSMASIACRSDRRNAEFALWVALITRAPRRRLPEFV